jgi:hypothetical protein
MKARVLVLPLLALALFGCQKNGAKTAEPAPQPYKFPHAMHIESGVACLECHAPILKATELKPNVVDVQIPQKNDLCLGCHDPLPPYKPVQRFEPVVRFDHAAHLPRVKNAKDQCTVCHVKIAEPGSQEVQVPPMHTCTSCHNHEQDFAVGRCTPCHLDLRRYEKPVAQYTHEAQFLETHGRWARNNVATCSSCHDQTMCGQCHTATTRPMPPSVQFPEKVNAEFIHRGDWISRHQIEAAADPVSCTKCHGTGYCQSCHAFQGVAPSGGSVRDPHPAGWISTHGSAARQNILSCAGCHNQGAQSLCVACHSSGKVNPHPPGFKGNQSQISSNPMCKICHQLP